MAGAKAAGRLFKRMTVLEGEFGRFDVEYGAKSFSLDYGRGVPATRDVKDSHRLPRGIAGRRTVAKPERCAKAGDLFLDPIARGVGLGLGPDTGDSIPADASFERRPRDLSHDERQRLRRHLSHHTHRRHFGLDPLHGGD